MNPFLMMLIQMLQQQQQNPFSSYLNPGFNSQGSMFNPGFGGNPFVFNPFPFSPFPTGGVGNPPQRGLPERPMDTRRRVEPSQPTLQPLPNQQPVDIPAPIPGRNLYGGQPKLQPLPTQPVDIPAPPNPVPARGMTNEPYYIEPIPGIRVPINMTGIYGPNGMGQNTLPIRPNNPNALGIPSRY